MSLDRIGRALIPPNPYDFPRWARRLFVLTLPVSGPLLLAWWGVVFVGMGLFGAAALTGIALAWVVTPIVVPLLWLAERAYELWSWSDDPLDP